MFLGIIVWVIWMLAIIFAENSSKSKQYRVK